MLSIVRNLLLHDHLDEGLRGEAGPHGGEREQDGGAETFGYHYRDRLVPLLRVQTVLLDSARWTRRTYWWGETKMVLDREEGNRTLPCHAMPCQQLRLLLTGRMESPDTTGHVVTTISLRHRKGRPVDFGSSAILDGRFAGAEQQSGCRVLKEPVG